MDGMTLYAGWLDASAFFLHLPKTKPCVLIHTVVQSLSTFDPPYVTLKSRVPMFRCKVVSHIVLKGEIIFGLVFGKVT